MDAATREKIILHLESRGLRRTSQRLAIIDAAFSTTEHFTAEDLCAAAKAIDSTVSRATVYRTIPILVETGLLHELDLGKATKYYDPNYATHPTHNHLICLDCDKIVEFEDPNLEAYENKITASLGFKPANKHLRIEAKCDELHNKGKCSNSGKCTQKP